MTLYLSSVMGGPRIRGGQGAGCPPIGWPAGPYPLFQNFNNKPSSPATWPLTEAAVRPQESRRAVAGSRGRVARAAIETLTNLFTAWPIALRWASCRETEGLLHKPGAGVKDASCSLEHSMAALQASAVLNMAWPLCKL